MHMNMPSASSLALVALLASTAWAQSLEEKQWRAHEDQLLQTRAGYFKTSCNATVAASIDWASGFTKDKSKSPALLCEYAIQGVLRVCAAADGKEAVQKQIKSFTCTHGAAKKFELKDGAAIDTITDSEAPDTSSVQAYLLKTLK